ncbi:MAG: hypothetical protein ABR507_10200 [Actinomycetota bacterium]|nr:hypothetical protein [Actinomycetota bacterium]
MHCPRCKSLNRDDAEFCSLCLLKFEPAPSTASPSTPAPSTAGPSTPAPSAASPSTLAPSTAGPVGPIDTGATLNVGLVPKLQPEDSPEVKAAWGKVADTPHDADVEARSGPITKRGKVLAWTCPSCDNENPMSSNRCSVCGTSFYDAFKSEDDDPKIMAPKDPRVAGALSLVPGLGHLYLGETIDGVSRVIIGLWWLLTALFLPSPRVMLLVIKLCYFAAYAALVAVSAYDATRKAEDPKAVSLLSARTLLYSSIGLGALLIFGGLAASFAARK